MHELLGRQRECAVLDDLIGDLREGRSGALVVRGEAGVGKSVLLDYVAGRASGCRVSRACGIESEMELTFAGLRQLCGQFLNRLDRLPVPQRDALSTAFGLTRGPVPDRFVVALATLSLLAEAADEMPVVCLVDDVHWFDHASARVLGFVARRLDMERVALVVGIREPNSDSDFSGVAELVLGGLNEVDARRLLESVIKGPIDERVRSRIIAETRGNPLALLELPRAWTAAELAEGLSAADAMPLIGRIEESFLKRLASLSEEAVRLLLIAAAEPLGDPTLLWGAAERLGIGSGPAAAAETSGLIEFSPRVRFRHPLVRSVVYRSARQDDRKVVHAALAEATDPELDPDRRAWHRAGATSGVDEQVASELERCAESARARGGSAAPAAFLERAASLTPDAGRRADRLLAAAVAKHSAGALKASLALLTAVSAGPPSALRAAEAEALRGRIAFDERRAGDAARLLVHAAELFRPLDPDRARGTYLEALGAAMWASGPDSASDAIEVARAVRAAPRVTGSPQAMEVVLDALALRVTEGYAASAKTLRSALTEVRDMTVGADQVSEWLWRAGNRGCGIIAIELWDLDSTVTLATRQVQLSREVGALAQLQFALNFLGSTQLISGDLAEARRTIDEDRLIAQALGNQPVGYLEPWYAALRGQEAEAMSLIDDLATGAAARRQRRIVDFASYYRAILYNGLGRPEEALAAAAQVFDRDIIGYFALLVPELAEAAAHTDSRSVLDAILRWLAERTRVTSSEWLLGVEARVRALACDDDSAEALHRESLERLSRTQVRAEVGRGRLLYGQWLRRQGRRVEARRQLQAAHDMLATMGLDAFAERARRELRATGARLRRRDTAAKPGLTAQESLIARLAGDGLSNPEIGQRLFLSPRTVEWHLRKVFSTLGIASRRELRAASFDG